MAAVVADDALALHARAQLDGLAVGADHRVRHYLQLLARFAQLVTEIIVSAN